MIIYIWSRSAVIGFSPFRDCCQLLIAGNEDFWISLFFSHHIQSTYFTISCFRISPKVIGRCNELKQIHHIHANLAKHFQAQLSPFSDLVRFRALKLPKMENFRALNFSNLLLRFLAHKINVLLNNFEDNFSSEKLSSMLRIYVWWESSWDKFSS